MLFRYTTCSCLLTYLILNLFFAQARAFETKPDKVTAKPAITTLTALGERLFSDSRLSGNREISCSSCHQQDKAFADHKSLAQGIDGKQGTRNTPSLLNVRDAAPFFWDGRRLTLEEQVLDPIFNPQEHGLNDEQQLLQIIGSDTAYTKAFAVLFPGEAPTINMRKIRIALATYLRSLRSVNSRFDQFLAKPESGLLSERERNGLALFNGSAHCAECHRIDGRATFSDNQFHNRGIGLGAITDKLPDYVNQVVALSGVARERLMSTHSNIAALGRFVVTAHPADIGKFKTPSLRNVAITAPYMHDGSIATLEEAVKYEIYYLANASGQTSNLTHEEQADIVEFLKSLTDVRYEKTRSYLP